MQNSTTLLANIPAPTFLFGDSMTCCSKLSLHFLGDAFVAISHDISIWICSMHHVLPCSRVSVAFISTSSHPPSDTVGTNAHTHKSLHLSCFSFTRNSITVHWQINVTDSHSSSQYTAETLMRKHIHQTCIHTKQ